MSVNPCPKKNSALIPGVIAFAGLFVYYLLYDGYSITLWQFFLLTMFGLCISFATERWAIVLPLIEGFTSIVTFNYTEFANVLNLMNTLKDLISMFGLMTFSVYLGACVGRILKDKHVHVECMKRVIPIKS